MNNLSFNILQSLFEANNITKEELARTFFKSNEEIEKAITYLINEKYISESRNITKKGIKELNEHKIDNAIILAAGMSTRFVPLNFEKPKGLLSVKGEPLIERQINQLRDKGIQEIIIVVGYMKEQFEYLIDKYGVTIVESTEYSTRNNHSSILAARKYLKNSIVTSSDLYFTENIFQKYAYDSYYCTIYVPGKTAERGIETDSDDKIISTMYGDRCCDIWVTLGYAFFSKRFSDFIIEYIDKEYDLPETVNKFWADIQDEHLSDLYMYAKRCGDGIIYEFDSLEELREFDDKYLYNSDSKIMKKICYRLGVEENKIIGIESMRKVKASLFKFRCKGCTYLCDVEPDDSERISLQGRVYYLCHDTDDDNIKLYKMDKNIKINGEYKVDTDADIQKLYDLSEDFHKYHQRALPLCAAENVVSDFANIPLSFGFQERYIMNNTYSFNMDDNFIGCEKLFPFYQMLSDTCSRVFGAKYTDPRPFTGMHCIDMITKTVCKSGERMMILGKEYGGHASVKPVVERLGIEVYEAPYDLYSYDLDYEAVNKMIKEKQINYVLLAPSDIIRPLNVEKIDTSECVLMWDCSQLMGLIAAGLCSNPLKTMKNIIMFGGTHKTFPGPASGLIMTNEKYLHDLMETSINPKFLRHSQMHQKISLLFSLIEFEKFGKDYMSHMVHCSNYLGEKLREKGFDVADFQGQISATHQIFIRCSKEQMNTIYDNAYKCEITLNKKVKKLFNGYGIRLGTQEIARYDWNDTVLDKIADIMSMIVDKNINITKVRRLVDSLPRKQIHFTFDNTICDNFNLLKEEI